jgi:hypothetical protein
MPERHQLAVQARRFAFDAQQHVARNAAGAGRLQRHRLMLAIPVEQHLEGDRRTAARQTDDPLPAVGKVLLSLTSPSRIMNAACPGSP